MKRSQRAPAFAFPGRTDPETNMQGAAQPPSPLLSARDAAPRLALSLDGFYRRVRAGIIPFVRVGSRSYRFDPSALDAFVAANSSRLPADDATLDREVTAALIAGLERLAPQMRALAAQIRSTPERAALLLAAVDADALARKLCNMSHFFGAGSRARKSQ